MLNSARWGDEVEAALGGKEQFLRQWFFSISI